jgi:predicted NBD/HSP70 family sugar kinase
MNERAALYALLRHGAMSRVELDHAIGLSKPAAAELLRRLEISGLVCRSGFQPVHGPGPQAQLWTANVAAGYAAGVDISATSVDVAIADLGGTVRGEAKVSTRGNRRQDPAQAVRTAIEQAAKSCSLQPSDVVHTVAGIQGSVDPVTGHLEYATHMPRWQGFDVRQRLRAALGGAVTVENDVNLVTVDEVANGRGRGCRNVVLLWMSRGVAVAAMVDGRLVRGSRGGAGEIDRVPMVRGGESLTIRDLLSNRAVLGLARQYEIPGATISAVVRRGLSVPEFTAELTERVTLALCSLVALLDPDLVILAGDIAMAGQQTLADQVRGRLHDMLAHRPQVAIASGAAHSVRQGALHAAIGAAREEVFGRGVGESADSETNLESWLLPPQPPPGSP